MRAIRSLPRIADIKHGLSAIIAAVIVGPALMAADPPARDRPIDAFMVQAGNSHCGDGVAGGTQFVATRGGGGTRSLELCGNGADHSAVTANALSEAIEAAGDDHVIRRHARMPELLSLRVARARLHAETSVAAEDRVKTLAALDARISELEMITSASALSE